MSDQDGRLIEAAQAFAKQFGDDSEFNRLLMEIILEELMSATKFQKIRETADGDNL